MGLKKSKAYVERINFETRFVKGGKSWNKGKKHPASGRSPETQFKKGARPHNWSPIGTESTIKGDYLTRKVTDTGVSNKDFVPVHHLVWIEHTRQQIPKDHALIFKDGNKRNFDIDNLELITRAELMRRNSIMALPPEISAQARIIGAFNRKLRRIERERNSREPTKNTQ